MTCPHVPIALWLACQRAAWQRCIPAVSAGHRIAALIFFATNTLGFQPLRKHPCAFVANGFTGGAAMKWSRVREASNSGQQRGSRGNRDRVQSRRRQCHLAWLAALKCVILAALAAARRRKAGVESAHQRGVKVVKVRGQQDGVRVSAAAR